MALLPVYIPTFFDTHIAAGSGIVGEEGSHEGDSLQMLVYFEGNLYGFIGGGYNERIFHAADRMLTKYPTMGRAYLERSKLTHVGWWDHEQRKFTPLDSPEVEGAIQSWLASVGEGDPNA